MEPEPEPVEELDVQVDEDDRPTPPLEPVPESPTITRIRSALAEANRRSRWWRA